MTHDGSDVATPGRWRMLLGSRRISRVTAMAPVDETTVELPNLTQLADQALRAENLLLRLTTTVDAMLPKARTREHQNDLLDLLNLLTGKAK